MKIEIRKMKLKHWLWIVICLFARGYARAARVNRDVLTEMDEEYRKTWGNFKGKGLL